MIWICYLKPGYLDSKGKDKFYVLFIDRGTSVKELFTVYLPLFFFLIIYIFSKKFHEGCITLIIHATNIPLMEKPRVWFSLATCVKSNCGKVIFEEKMQVNGLDLTACYYHVTYEFQSEFTIFWLNSWVFVYELSGSGLESRCCHLNGLHVYLTL